MSKDAVAAVEAMGIPAAQIVLLVKQEVKRATHKDAKGKACPPDSALVAAFVTRHIQPSHLESFKAWLIATLAEAV